MIGTTGLKRKSSSSINASTTLTNSINPISTLNKKFRGTAFDGSQQNNGSNKSLQSNSMKSDASSMINGGETVKSYKRLDESDLTPQMLTEYRRLQHELQCQEALLVLMQKLKSNQRLISQNNHQNNGVKQRATATKLNQQQPQPQPTSVDGKTPLTATKQSQSQLTNNVNRSTPNKTPHPNQYTVNRTNTNSQNLSHSSSKTTLSSQATRQSNTNSTGNNLTNSLTTSNSATRLSSTTVPNSATKTSAVPSTNTGSSSSNGTSSKSNGAAAEQHLLNAKLALRKQLEQTLLQIPTPKPTTCDLTFIPGVNGWSEFLAYLGLEQAFNTYSDIVNRRPPTDISMTLPYVCAQCGTDWSVTWHEISSTTENNSIEEKILCDRCTKTSQKKLLKQDHSNRLRQAFIKALQQEKELDAKFQSQSTSSSTSSSSSGNNSSNNTTTNTSTTSVAVKTSSSSPSLSSSKHVHSSSSSNKHSSKPLSTKTSSNHHHHHHHHNSTSNNHNHHHHHHHHNSTSNNHNHHHHHHHSSSSSKTSSSSKSHHNATSTIPPLTPSPADALASTLAAFQTPEQMELFQKHFLSTMLPFAAVANQAAAAAALTAKSSQQQQQALAAFPAMAASLMRQPNPAQYLLDMIPQAAKQQQQQQQQSQHHHHHSK